MWVCAYQVKETGWVVTATAQLLEKPASSLPYQSGVFEVFGTCSCHVLNTRAAKESNCIVNHPKNVHVYVFVHTRLSSVSVH